MGQEGYKNISDTCDKIVIHLCLESSRPGVWGERLIEG